MRGKSKSSHDLTDDPKLSAIPAIESEGEEKTTNDEEEQADEVITIFSYRYNSTLIVFVNPLNNI